jgi:hypothetical protein
MQKREDKWLIVQFHNSPTASNVAAFAREHWRTVRATDAQPSFQRTVFGSG